MLDKRENPPHVRLAFQKTHFYVVLKRKQAKSVFMIFNLGKSLNQAYLSSPSSQSKYIDIHAMRVSGIHNNAGSCLGDN